MKVYSCLPTVVFKIIGTYKLYTNPINYSLGFTLYSTFVLATTLWCTLLIIYRIVSVARAGGGLRAYRHIIEVLVESSAVYSAFLILYVVFDARDPTELAYFDVLAGIARVRLYNFPDFVINCYHTGRRSDTSCWTRRSRLLSSRRLLEGRCNIKLPSLRGTLRRTFHDERRP